MGEHMCALGSDGAEQDDGDREEATTAMIADPTDDLAGAKGRLRNSGGARSLRRGSARESASSTSPDPAPRAGATR